MKVASTTAVAGLQTIIDSGTTIMYGPPDAVQILYSKIPGSALVDSVNGGPYLILRPTSWNMIQVSIHSRALRHPMWRSVGALA